MARSRRGQSGQSLLNGGGFTYLPWSNNDLNEVCFALEAGLDEFR